MQLTNILNNYYVSRVCVCSLRYPALFAISNIAKILRMVAELLRADGRTDGHLDMTELIVVSHNVTNLPKNEINVET
jgi:hypothetical protein